MGVEENKTFYLNYVNPQLRNFEYINYIQTEKLKDMPCRFPFIFYIQIKLFSSTEKWPHFVIDTFCIQGRE